MVQEFHHITVLETELYQQTLPETFDFAIDCTSGGGGHTKLLLDAVSSNGQVLAVDQDEAAILHLKKRFTKELESKKLLLAHSPFAKIGELVESYQMWGKVDGIIADLGVSSPHLDQPERGFSFNKSGPLDMRMDTGQELDAAQVINTYDVEDLIQIFREYGEEPRAVKLAKAIGQRREQQPFDETLAFAEFVAKTLAYRTPSKKHPATRAFQALRIEVNQEYKQLDTLISTGFETLRPGGRMGIISFHSGEDRMIKKAFKSLAAVNAPPKGIPLTEEQLKQHDSSKGVIVKPFPFAPSAEEIKGNPRARSAKLRVIEKK